MRAYGDRLQAWGVGVWREGQLWYLTVDVHGREGVRHGWSPRSDDAEMYVSRAEAAAVASTVGPDGAHARGWVLWATPRHPTPPA